MARVGRAQAGSSSREPESDARRGGDTSASDEPYSDKETLEQLRKLQEYRRRKAEIKSQFLATRRNLIINKPLPWWFSLPLIGLFIYVTHLLDAWYRPEAGYTTKFDQPSSLLEGELFYE